MWDPVKSGGCKIIQLMHDSSIGGHSGRGPRHIPKNEEVILLVKNEGVHNLPYQGL